VILDSAGNLYGTTPGGGKHNAGVVYELSPSTGGRWTEKVLHAFTGGNGGRTPTSLTLDNAGNLYGTTWQGGPLGAHGPGVVFKLAKDARSWKETTLYAFTGGADGRNPRSGVILDGLGNVYGTTSKGGSSQKGVVFQLTAVAKGWTETVLHNFTAVSEGYFPLAQLLFDGAGNLYGTTVYDGGGGGNGTVFKLTPGSGRWTYTVVYGFPDSSDGRAPEGALILDGAGNLYGTTVQGGGSRYGAVFEVTP
jgi:uncharacterized repeat protein (TIGR03803 family)